ncbi:flavodoxin family protein [uncultured Cloacibacillus sp.]|uniref:flavodoxin family protein n=1 Tax=uncultured Cloacibacillus sp. TaxID=889794 RepID=UPI001FA22358|nr:flavodoxin family protein [uncultured Cloacibacillus sp.]HIR16648.1 flavodoxin family protein [Candidatus Caccocola faecigallinarum]
MGKKIIVLNGSPRKNGNTSALVKAFREGAESAGHTVTEFWLGGMKINGCRGCCAGGKNPESPCVQKDDMEQIYPAYKEADVVVLASPLYYWTISGQLKCAFDRLFAVAECDPNYTNPRKESALLMAAEGNGFEETVYWYDRLMGHIGWKDWGKVLCGGVMAVGDIEGKPELEEARRLGASIK